MKIAAGKSVSKKEKKAITALIRLCHNRNVQLLRKVFFNLFVLAYAWLCPLIILYSFGYVFDFKQMRFSQTGLVAVSSVPSGAEVYVGRRLHPQKTPASLSGLVPGAYTIRLVKENYLPWELRATVTAGKPLVLENILLLPSRPELQALAPEPFAEIIPIQGTAYFLLKKNENLCGLYAYDCSSENLFPVFPERQEKLISVFTMSESPLIGVCAQGDQGRSVYRIPLHQPPLEPTDITALVSQGMRNLRWEAEDPRRLFGQRGEEVLLADPDEQSPRVFIANAVTFTIYKKQVYAMDRGGNLVKKPADKGQGEEIAGFRFPKVASNWGRVSLLPFPGDQVFLLAGGAVYFNSPPYLLGAQGVRGIAPFGRTKSLLVWEAGRVGVMDVEGEDDRQIEWLYAGSSIRQCQPLNDIPRILFEENGSVMLLEPAAGGKNRPREICAIKKGRGFFYHENSGWLYYLDAASSFPCRMRIERGDAGLIEMK